MGSESEDFNEKIYPKKPEFENEEIKPMKKGQHAESSVF